MIDLTLDYHSHILPGCDHGSANVKTSLQQVAMAQEIGIETICATSHFYPHKEDIESFLARRQKCYQRLMEHLPEDSPEILLGAEVLICNGMERLEQLPALCRQGTRELLLEMPFYQWPEQLWDTVFLLHERQDIDIVIAHADRYPPEDIEVLIRENIPLQLNAEALLKPLKRRRYLSWISKGYVHYLGSDIHKLGSGYQDYAKASKIIRRHVRG